jgi:hypothetical protein
MTVKYSAKIITALLSLAVSVPALSSGSESGGGGGFSGGGFGSGTSNFPSEARQYDPAKAAYSRGKSMFKKNITCSKCLYAKGVKDGVTATEVALKVRAGEFNLSAEEQEDIMIFIKKRYGIEA